MHYERDGSPAFVFDLTEPERPKVDRAVLAFLKSETLHPVRFHDPSRWGREAQSGVGEERGPVGSVDSVRNLREVKKRYEPRRKQPQQELSFEGEGQAAAVAFLVEPFAPLFFGAALAPTLRPSPSDLARSDRRAA